VTEKLTFKVAGLESEHCAATPFTFNTSIVDQGPGKEGVTFHVTLLQGSQVLKSWQRIVAGNVSSTKFSVPSLSYNYYTMNVTAVDFMKRINGSVVTQLISFTVPPPRPAVKIQTDFGSGFDTNAHAKDPNHIDLNVTSFERLTIPSLYDPTAKVGKCTFGSIKDAVKYKWTVVPMDGSKLVLDKTIVVTNSDIAIPPRTLRPGNKYRISVEAYYENYPAFPTKGSVNVYVMPAAVFAQISQGSAFKVKKGTALTFKGQVGDADGEKKTYTWSVAPMCRASCPEVIKTLATKTPSTAATCCADNAYNTLISSNGTIASDYINGKVITKITGPAVDTDKLSEKEQYLIKLVVTKASGATTTAYSIMTLSTMSVPSIDIHLWGPETAQLAFEKDQYMSFTADVTLDGGDCYGCTYLWYAAPHANLSDTVSWTMKPSMLMEPAVLNEPSLTFDKDLFTGGKTYGFTLQVTSSEGIVGFSTIEVTINIPPFNPKSAANEALSLSNSTGGSDLNYQELAVFTTKGWVDKHLPLSYQFGYFLAEDPEEFVTFLGSYVYSDTIKTSQLPIGTITPVVFVKDRFGAVTFDSGKKIVVKPPYVPPTSSLTQELYKTIDDTFKDLTGGELGDAVAGFATSLNTDTKTTAAAVADGKLAREKMSKKLNAALSSGSLTTAAKASACHAIVEKVEQITVQAAEQIENILDNILLAAVLTTYEATSSVFTLDNTMLARQQYYTFRRSITPMSTLKKNAEDFTARKTKVALLAAKAMVAGEPVKLLKTPNSWTQIKKATSVNAKKHIMRGVQIKNFTDTKGGTPKIVSIVVTNTTAKGIPFSGATEGKTVSSEMVGAMVMTDAEGELKQTSMNPKATITVYPSKDITQVGAVYFEPSAYAWSSAGVSSTQKLKAASAITPVVLETTHLTNFGVREGGPVGYVKPAPKPTGDLDCKAVVDGKSGCTTVVQDIDFMGMAIATFVGDVFDAYEATFAADASDKLYNMFTKTYSDKCRMIMKPVAIGGGTRNTFTLTVLQSFISSDTLKASITARRSAASFLAKLTALKAAGGYSFPLPSLASLKAHPPKYTSSGGVIVPGGGCVGDCSGTVISGSSGGTESFDGQWWAVLMIVVICLSAVVIIVGIVLLMRGPDAAYSAGGKASAEFETGCGVEMDDIANMHVEADVDVDVDVDADVDVDVNMDGDVNIEMEVSGDGGGDLVLESDMVVDAAVAVGASAAGAAVGAKLMSLDCEASAEVACVACGNIMMPDAKFCRECGEPRPVVDVSAHMDIGSAEMCENCGSQFMPDAKFCRECGEPRPANKDQV
jgi:RNA polymerase subunit RPABC4/transcription elongation factor Spt4